MPLQGEGSILVSNLVTTAIIAASLPAVTPHQKLVFLSVVEKIAVAGCARYWAA